MSRRPGNGDCRKGTAGADPQWPVHVCRTRLSETVIARAIAENGARRARSGAARSQNAGPVDHLPAAQPSRFVASSRYLTAACISSASHAGQSSWADNPDTPTLRPAATSPRTARLFTIGITVACGDDSPAPTGPTQVTLPPATRTLNTLRVTTSDAEFVDGGQVLSVAETVDLTACAVYSDDTEDCTITATWQSPAVDRDRRQPTVP